MDESPSLAPAIPCFRLLFFADQHAAREVGLRRHPRRSSCPGDAVAWGHAPNLRRRPGMTTSPAGWRHSSY